MQSPRRRSASGAVVYGVPGQSLWSLLLARMPTGSMFRALGVDGWAIGLLVSVIVGAVAYVAGGPVIGGCVAAGGLALTLLVARVRRGSGSRAAVAACRSTGDMRAIPDELGHMAWGAVAETNVGKGLDRLGPGYVVIHDWQLERAGQVRGNVDHLVITPEGALVMIDTKMWRGSLGVSGGRFTSKGDSNPAGYRGASVNTLRWAASMLPIEPDLIVVAVYGRGTVTGDQVWITDGAIPITAVHSRDLHGLLCAVEAPQRSRGVHRALGVRRSWYKR